MHFVRVLVSCCVSLHLSCLFAHVLAFCSCILKKKKIYVINDNGNMSVAKLM